ncbi:unnamed protein product [Rangifer tarandus platyrhynchus]|uniref:Uncharacterized protein n=1 Tax=Rangifer tarandus platyrhynchus TaxID=3082113 RepID=A0ACB1MJ73_RANTA
MGGSKRDQKQKKIEACGLPAQLAREVRPAARLPPESRPRLGPPKQLSACDAHPTRPRRPDRGSAPARDPHARPTRWVASGLWEAEPRVVGLNSSPN